jgi:hypothetical protein
MQDIPIAEFEHLGNWSTSQHEEAYSTKINNEGTLGYGRTRGDKGELFICTWCAAFIPPEEVQTHFFSFVDAALVQVNAMNKKGCKRVTAFGFLNMLKRFRVVILQDTAELIAMGRGGHAVFRHKVFQYQLFIEWVKSLRAGLKVQPPASNLALYNLAIDKAVKKCHHALSGGLHQYNTTNVSTLKEVQDLKTVLEESSDRLITKEYVGELFARGAELFHTKKHQASQITPEKSPRMEQVSTIPRLSKDIQEATSATTATATAIIMTTPTTIAAAPIIQVTSVRDIGVDQDLLPLAQEAKEYDEMILDLSEIDTNAVILRNWENYKPNFIFRPDVKKEPLALCRDWHRGVEEIHRNKKC